MFWMLVVVLHPCCEIIASSVPHDHAQSQGVHAEHFADGGDVIPDHRHCETNVTDVGDLAVLIIAKHQLNLPHPKSDKLFVWREFPYELTVVSLAYAIPAFHGPPPGPHNWVYLQTQRFRI